MIEKEILKESAQSSIDKVYGENEWKILEYNGSHEPCFIKHKCGLERTVSRFSTLKLGKAKCRCQHSKTGRPRLSFDELNKRISDATYGTYELIELIDSANFIVNHKSCQRSPFKTSITRFFTRDQRCACSKKIRMSKKSKKDVNNINNLVEGMNDNAN